MPTMRDRSITLRGDIVGDERQLDGSRHLTLDLVDAADAWSCTLSLVVDRHNRLREGIVELDGPERSGSAVLDRVLDLQVEPVLTLVAEFRDTARRPTRPTETTHSNSPVRLAPERPSNMGRAGVIRSINGKRNGSGRGPGGRRWRGPLS
jgi:hypothetical protein